MEVRSLCQALTLRPLSVALATCIDVEHGRRIGSTVARFAGSTLSARLSATPLYQARDFPAALTRTFLATDEDLRANPDFAGDPSGCTAVAVIVDHRAKQIICVSPTTLSPLEPSVAFLSIHAAILALLGSQWTGYESESASRPREMGNTKALE